MVLQLLLMHLQTTETEQQLMLETVFTKGGGNVGTQGCVAYMFDEKGQIIIDKEECDMDPDELMMTAIDAGAEDFQDEEDSYEVITDPNEFSVVREALEAAGVAYGYRLKLQ